MSRRIISLFLAILLSLSLAIVPAFADEPALDAEMTSGHPSAPMTFVIESTGPGHSEIIFDGWKWASVALVDKWNITPVPDPHAYLKSFTVEYEKWVPKPWLPRIEENSPNYSSDFGDWVKVSIEYPGNAFDLSDLPEWPHIRWGYRSGKCHVKVKLVFEAYTKLDVTKTGNGASYGEVDVQGAVESDTAFWYFMPDAKATLTADPSNPHNQFIEWGDDLSGSMNPATIAMDADKSVSAEFRLNQYALALEKIGDGDGNMSGAGSFPAYAQPSVLASPDASSRFDGWFSDSDGTQQLSTHPHFTIPPIETDTTYYAKFSPYTITFRKMIAPLSSDLPPDLAFGPSEMEDLMVPEDGQFSFTLLQLVEPVQGGPALSMPLIQYNKTATNDAEGWVTFGPDPKAGMYLRPGMYLLTETDDPNDFYYPCTIGENGILLELKWDGRFRFRGPYNPVKSLSELAGTEYDGPEFCGRDRPKVVVNCEIPVPGLAIDKRANGLDGPVSAYTNESVGYTIRVTNIGNVTVSDIHLLDSLSPNSPYDPFDLEPAMYRDFDYPLSFDSAGSYTNVATASGIWLNHVLQRQDVPELPPPMELPGDVVGPVTDAVTVLVTVRPPTPSPSTTTFFVNQTNVNLTLVIEGPGTVLPGSGAYSISSLVQFDVTPGAGATFSGWFGTNGSEVAENRLLMNGDKTVIARFAVPEAIPAQAIPEAAPAVIPELVPEPVPEAAPALEMSLTEEIPQAAPALPKTGGLPSGLVAFLATGMLGAGFMLRRKHD